MLRQLKSSFVRGVFVVLPLAITGMIVLFGYNTIYKLVKPLGYMLPYELRAIPLVSEIFPFLVMLVLVIAIGIAVKSFLISPIVRGVEGMIMRIPLVKTIYSSAKMIVETFNTETGDKETRAIALLEFPRNGVYSIAFVFDRMDDGFNSALGKNKDFVRVFVPNSPNPTTGYFMIVPREDLIMTDLEFDEAIRAIMSCGIMVPEIALSKRNNPDTGNVEKLS